MGAIKFRKQESPNTKKVFVSIWAPLLESFNTKVEKACLRRDVFLDRVLSCELELLESEGDQKNSDDAKRCITEHFTQLNKKWISLTFATDTIERLKAVCERRNIVRDAFINRVMLCLVAKPSVLKRLFPIDDYRESVFKYWDKPGHTHLWQSLDTMSELVADPFSFIRECLGRAREETGETDYTFYQSHIPDGLFGDKVKGTLGLNVFLPDVLVPGHPANKQLLDDLFDDLEKADARNGKEAA